MDKHALKVSLLTLCIWTAHCTSTPPQTDSPRPEPTPEPALEDATADLPSATDMSSVEDEPKQPDERLDMSQEMDSPAAPTPPAGLVRYLIGDDADAQVTPSGPGWILMGGGPDVDEAFMWWKEKLNGGDVVVLRTSGEDGYNDYLYNQIGGANSVETLLVTSRQLADDPYVAQRVALAEGIFIAGGDQATYTQSWRDTALSRALKTASERGAIIGGTSAGCAVLGQFIFSAVEGTISSKEAIEAPYSPKMVIEDALIEQTPLTELITDTHFYERDRMGRLVAFVARLKADERSSAPLGIGVDEGTALVIDAGEESVVMGEGFVYVVDGSRPAAQCEQDKPLIIEQMPYTRFEDGQRFSLGQGARLSFDRSLQTRDGDVEAITGRLY